MSVLGTVLPPEVREFLAVPGRVLTVKGQAGTGKTLFAQQAGRWFQREHGDVIWTTSRYSDPEARKRVDDILREVERIDYRPGSEGATHGPAPPGARLDQAHLLEDLAMAMERSDAPLVIIDSFDGLVEDLPGTEQIQLLGRIVGLARASGGRVLLILESDAEHPADYQSDGVIRLTAQQHEGRRVRQLFLDKLRGTPIQKAAQAFTLANGEFSTFQRGRFEAISAPIEAPAREDEPTGEVSTGTNGWDLLLDGGFEPGSTHLLEVDASASTPQDLLTVPLAVNTLNLERGLVCLQPPNLPAGVFEKRVHPHTRGGTMDALATILDAADLGKARYAARPSREDVQEALAPLELARERVQAQGPVTSILHLDPLFSAFGTERTLSWIASWTAATHDARSIDLLVTGSHRSDVPASLIDTRWQLETIDDVVFLHGTAPATGLYAVQGRVERGFPESALVAVR